MSLRFYSRPWALTTILLSLLGIGGCSSRPVKEPPKASATKKPAPPKTKNKVTPQSASRTVFDGHLQQARSALSSRDFRAAHSAFEKARTAASTPAQEQEAIIGSLRASVEGGLSDEFSALLPLALEKIPPQDPHRTEVVSHQLAALYGQEGKLPFLTALQLESIANPGVLAVWNERALAVIKTQLSAEEKTIVLNGNFPDAWKAQLQAELAGEQIKQVLEPQLVPSEKAPTDALTIGAVLPLSGKNSTLAKRALRGLQLGLGLKSQDPSGFRLVVGDSEGRPEKAKRQTEKLIHQEGAIAIVGSLLSRNAPAVAAAASGLETPSISLSQRSGLTQQFQLTYRNAVTAEIQVKALVKIAMKDLGLTRFAVIYPNDAYGTEMANLFWDEVLARGGKIVSAGVYAPEETDFKKTIESMVGLAEVDTRAEEYRLRLKEKKDKKKESSLRNEDSDVLPPIVDFQAVFIPDSVKALGQISAMLAYAGVRNVHLLGPNLWNNSQLPRRVNQSFNPILFVDFPSIENEETEFIRLFRNEFGESPGPFELQAYDAGLMLRTLISEGSRDRQSLARALEELKSFPGGLGPLVQFPVREFHRPLQGWTLLKGQISPYLLAQ